MVDITVHFVCNAVIADIYEKEYVLPADRFMERSLSFPGAEAGAGSFGKIIVFYITLKSGIVFGEIIYCLSEFYQIVVDTVCQLCGGLRGNNLQRGNWYSSLQFM